MGSSSGLWWWIQRQSRHYRLELRSSIHQQQVLPLELQSSVHQQQVLPCVGRHVCIRRLSGLGSSDILLGLVLPCPSQQIRCILSTGPSQPWCNLATWCCHGAC